MKIITGNLKGGRTAPAPSIECWIPEQEHNGIGLVIFPGGAYGGLAEHEGKGYAEHFSKAGIACFVVSYRLGSAGFRHPAMLEDALAAIYAIRSSAGEHGVDPHRLGVMGSSAGGHLAAHTLVAWNQVESDVSLRPDFGVLCYPVITSQGAYAHEGSMLNLAGEAASVSLLDELSCEKHVCADTPPCFIWHTAEDAGVPAENSMLFASALREHAVSFELHVYAKGRHGIGLTAPFAWETDCLRWIQEAAPPPR
ncbi:MAG: alpha/beta hydrolase [Verrucomicrobia bacterium]|nr:alpha/beta hydrolase [Verrucomicrobiota bacterium]MDA1086524.1 alpha/beta hydrolase [Verrucomicrobiota bacterium]